MCVCGCGRYICELVYVSLCVCVHVCMHRSAGTQVMCVCVCVCVRMHMHRSAGT